MRTLNTGRYTKVIVLDKPGQGNACYEYRVLPVDQYNPKVFSSVSFQNGPIEENFANGCQQEDLLAIVIDRLESFQAGEFACDENKYALMNIKQAMQFLNSRTLDRQERGVEGTSEQ